MSDRVPKRLELLTDGTALDGDDRWPGGKGTAVATVIGSLDGDLQALFDDTWVQVKDVNGNDVSFATTAEMFNFELPACKLRVNGTLTGGTVVVVGY